MHLEFLIPTRGLFGYKTEFLTDTKGEGVMNTIFDSYQPEKGEITKRFTGSLIAYEDGEATSYGIFNSQDRGPMFVEPAMKVYAGMLVGISSKGDDIVVNVCKKSTSPPSAPPARTRRCGWCRRSASVWRRPSSTSPTTS